MTLPGLSTPWSWTVLLVPLLFLLARILAYRSRNSRLRIFGEPALLGVSARRGRDLGAALLLLIATGLGTAMLPLAESAQETKRGELVEFVIDGADLSPPEKAMEARAQVATQLLGPLEGLASQFPGARYALTVAGQPEGLSVPATHDISGLRIRARSILATPGSWQTAAADRDLQIVTSRAAPPGANLHYRCIVSSREVDDLLRVLGPPPAGRDWAVIQTPPAPDQTRFLRARRPDEPVSSVGAAALAVLLRSTSRDENGSPRLGMTPLQQIAALALLVLCVECWCSYGPGKQRKE